ncbi:MAG: hypothetical protein K2W93_09480, partial [Burkholderiaceae bacterium]|nr:hypothetical protein [Burkholderiaceae bacterium]
MTVAARNKAMAIQARRIYVEALVRGMATLSQAISDAATQLLTQTGVPVLMHARREGVEAWQRCSPAWL